MRKQAMQNLLASPRYLCVCGDCGGESLFPL